RLVHVITRHRAARSPASINVAADMPWQDLLRMAIDTAVGRINLAPCVRDAARQRRRDVTGVGIDLRLGPSDLKIRNEDKSHPRRGEYAKNSRQNPGHAAHETPPTLVRAVDSVAGRMSRRKSMRAKCTAKVRCPSASAIPAMLRPIK